MQHNSAEMTKIVFFDIDGTLVSFNTHKIPQSTIDAIRRVRQQGVKIWIATGRPMPFISNLDGLEYDGIMCVNGAHCQLSNGEVIFSKPVEKQDVLRMIEEQKQNGVAVAYAGNERAMLAAPKGIPAEVDEVFSLLDIANPVLTPPEEALTFEVMQIIAFFKESDSKHIMSDILRECNETRWHPSFADCVAKNIDKSKGIDEVIKYYGFDISETMAFGDGGNDITMLKHAGIGVAMGNANDNVKEAADIVTDSVDNDGIAKILNKI